MFFIVSLFALQNFKIDIEDLFRTVFGCFAYGIRVATHTGKELKGRSIFLFFCSGNSDRSDCQSAWVGFRMVRFQRYEKMGIVLLLDR